MVGMTFDQRMDTIKGHVVSDWTVTEEGIVLVLSDGRRVEIYQYEDNHGMPNMAVRECK